MKKYKSFKKILAGAILLFFASCQKEQTLIKRGEENLTSVSQRKSKEKPVVSFFKYYGDSIGYNNNGLVSELWMNQWNYGTTCEYPSSSLAIVKTFSKENGDVMAEFQVTLNMKGLATQASVKKYTNGVVTKEYITKYAYDTRDHLVHIDNPNGNGYHFFYNYSGDKLESSVQEFGSNKQTYTFEYESMKVPVALPVQFRMSYDDFFFLSGLFLNGMYGKFTPYAVKSMINPTAWSAPVTFINTYGTSGEWLKSDPEYLSGETMVYTLQFKYIKLP